MKVDIWSDIRCPFCYIGKRKFEMAVEEFDHKGNVVVEWHSFELDPNIKTQPWKNSSEFIAELKGQSLEWAEKMEAHVTGLAKEVGLTYHLDKSVVANSFNAHRLIHLAKQQGLGDIAKEQLLKDYFTEGKNIDDRDTLIQAGVEIGLDAAAVTQMLDSNDLTDAVRDDEAMAQSMGINGVPFFVINGKYGISGAQAPETFLQALQQVWKEEETSKLSNIIDSADGASCSVDGNC